MTDGIDLSELMDAEKKDPLDFNRGSSGAPQVSDPDEEGGKKWLQYSRSSSFGDVLDSRDSLENWLVNRAMEGVAKTPELAAEVIAANGDKPALRQAREKAISAGRGRFKADLGTAFHRMSEHWEQQPDYDPGEPYRGALEKYEAQMKRLGLLSQHFEVKLVNDEFRAAGTADRIYELTIPLLTPSGEILPPGTLIIGDIKTGNMEYSVAGYCVQSAIYAGSTLYDVETNRRLPTPPINQSWGIIMHVDIESGEVEFIWIDLEVGRLGAQMAADTKEWRRAWRRKEGYKAGCQIVEPAPDDIVPKGFREVAEKHRAEVSDSRPDLLEFTRRRLAEFRKQDNVREWMLIRWPKGLPGPKKCSFVELLAMNEFLDAVETEFQMVFRDDDPRPYLDKEAS